MRRTDPIEEEALTRDAANGDAPPGEDTDRRRQRSWEQAASAGHSGAAYNLGLLFADGLDPPELTEARRWWEQAARAGHTLAAYKLGVLLADRLDPPELTEARRWWEQAARAE